MSQPPYSPPPTSGDPTPGYQNPGQSAPGYGPPPGQYPGYQQGPPPPAGFGAGGGMPPPPPGWGAPPPPQQHLARPSTVLFAFYALAANVVLGLIGAILVFTNQDAYIDDALRDAGFDPDSAGSSALVDSAYTAGAIIGLVFVALWVMFLWFAWKGHNWARIVIWVLGGLSLLGLFTAFSSPVSIIVIVNVLSLVLTIAAVVLLALKPSNDWYRFQSDARKYNWPGKA